MRKLFKCHYNYLISKTTLIIVGVILGFIIISYVLSSDALTKEVVDINQQVSSFEATTFFITKFLTIIIAVFLFSYTFLPNNDHYLYLLIPEGISRTEFILSKILVLLLILLAIIILLFCSFLLIGGLLIKKFVFKLHYLLTYSALFLLISVYGLYSLLLVQLLKNIFASLLAFSLMLTGEIVFEQGNSLLGKIIYFLFPSLTTDQVLYFGYAHIIVLLLVLIFANLYIYKQRDM